MLPHTDLRNWTLAKMGGKGYFDLYPTSKMVVVTFTKMTTLVAHFPYLEGVKKLDPPPKKKDYENGSETRKFLILPKMS